MAEVVLVKKPVTTEVEMVVLTLTHTEASVLRTILDRVGGDPDAGHPRGHSGDIARALRAFGIKPGDYNCTGSVYFND